VLIHMPFSFTGRGVRRAAGSRINKINREGHIPYLTRKMHLDLMTICLSACSPNCTLRVNEIPFSVYPLGAADVFAPVSYSGTTSCMQLLPLSGTGDNAY
jgi:hypothetical protein